jgi:hypothetical protein
MLTDCSHFCSELSFTARSIFVPNCLLQRRVFLFRIVFYIFVPNCLLHFCSELSFTARSMCAAEATPRPQAESPPPSTPTVTAHPRPASMTLGAFMFISWKSPQVFYAVFCVFYNGQVVWQKLHAAIFIWRCEVGAYETCLKLLNQRILQNFKKGKLLNLTKEHCHFELVNALSASECSLLLLPG